MTDERGRDEGREARRREMQLTPGIVLAVLIVAVVGFALYGWALDRNSNDLAKQNADLVQQGADRRDSEFAFCERLQTERNERNRGDAVVYLSLVEIITNVERRGGDASDYRERAEELRWTPETYCPDAVDRPLEYRPPSPQVFTVERAKMILMAKEP